MSLKNGFPYSLDNPFFNRIGSWEGAFYSEKGINIGSKWPNCTACI